MDAFFAAVTAFKWLAVAIAIPLFAAPLAYLPVRAATPAEAFHRFLLRLLTILERINGALGSRIAWLALAMVLVQFLVVLLRYVFGIGSIALQESIVYMHAMLFMLAAGYTLLKDGHVRVDIFYRSAPPRRQALVNLIGVYLFLIPFMGLVITAAEPYVAQSWQVFEGSKETSGIQGVFLLKSIIPAFGVLFLIQGLALAIRSALAVFGEAPPAAPHGALPV